MNELKSVSQYFFIEGSVSDSFNKLKGQIFNLIEASVTDEKQAKALKGLIKSFANEGYANCAKEMRKIALHAGYLSKEDFDDFPPMSANPLGNEIDYLEPKF